MKRWLILSGLATVLGLVGSLLPAQARSNESHNRDEQARIWSTPPARHYPHDSMPPRYHWGYSVPYPGRWPAPGWGGYPYPPAPGPMWWGYGPGYAWYLVVPGYPSAPFFLPGYRMQLMIPYDDQGYGIDHDEDDERHDNEHFNGDDDEHGSGDEDNDRQR